jgi:hypothetical protein
MAANKETAALHILIKSNANGLRNTAALGRIK